MAEPKPSSAAEPAPIPSFGRGPWPKRRTAALPERGAAAEPTPDTRPRQVPERPLAERARAELYDALTGLPSPALMIDRTERMVARVARHPDLVVGALFIEVDRLKDVYDELGEVAAKGLLKLVAERLAGVMRAGDTVGRLDGDEFVMLVESTVSDVPLDSLARRVIAALHAPVELEGFGPGVPMTVSVGAAVGPYASTDDLFRDARLALDSARAAGKDRFALFNASMRALVEGRGVLDVARP